MKGTPVNTMDREVLRLNIEGAERQRWSDGYSETVQMVRKRETKNNLLREAS